MKARSDDLPMLLVDTREQRPLQFSHLPAESATLYTGDYSVRGAGRIFAVERKSLADLAGSLTRERDRFMKEMHRLRGYRFPYLLAIGDDMELSRLIAQGRLKLHQVEHSLRAIQSRYGVHVERAYTDEQAARMVETWAFCAWRESMKPAGVSLPFPDWAVGVLCPRYLRPVSAGEVLDSIERSEI